MHVVRRDYGDTIATPAKKIILKGKLAKLKSSMTFFKARKSESFLENESWNLTGQSHMKKLPRKTDQLNNLCQMLLCGIIWKLCSSVCCKYLVIPFHSQGMHFCAVNTSDWKTWTELKNVDCLWLLWCDTKFCRVFFGFVSCRFHKSLTVSTSLRESQTLMLVFLHNERIYDVRCQTLSSCRFVLYCRNRVCKFGCFCLGFLSSFLFLSSAFFFPAHST